MRHELRRQRSRSCQASNPSVSFPSPHAENAKRISFDRIKFANDAKHESVSNIGTVTVISLKARHWQLLYRQSRSSLPWGGLVGAYSSRKAPDHSY